MTVHVDLAVCARCGHLREQHYYDGASMVAGGGPECAVHEDRGWWRRPKACGCRRFIDPATTPEEP